MHLERVDRISDAGNIVEHLVPAGTNKTLCGLVVFNSQRACGNRRCKNCERVKNQRGLQEPLTGDPRQA